MARDETDGLRAALIDGEVPGVQIAPILLVATGCQLAGNAWQGTSRIGKNGASSARTPIQFERESAGSRQPLPDKAGSVPVGRAKHRHGQIGRVEVHHSLTVLVRDRKLPASVRKQGQNFRSGQGLAVGCDGDFNTRRRCVPRRGGELQEDLGVANQSVCREDDPPARESRG